MSEEWANFGEFAAAPAQNVSSEFSFGDFTSVAPASPQAATVSNPQNPPSGDGFQFGAFNTPQNTPSTGGGPAFPSFTEFETALASASVSTPQNVPSREGSINATPSSGTSVDLAGESAAFRRKYQEEQKRRAIAEEERAKAVKEAMALEEKLLEEEVAKEKLQQELAKVESERARLAKIMESARTEFGNMKNAITQLQSALESSKAETEKMRGELSKYSEQYSTETAQYKEQLNHLAEEKQRFENEVLSSKNTARALEEDLRREKAEHRATKEKLEYALQQLVEHDALVNEQRKLNQIRINNLLNKLRKCSLELTGCIDDCQKEASADSTTREVRSFPKPTSSFQELTSTSSGSSAPASTPFGEFEPVEGNATKPQSSSDETTTLNNGSTPDFGFGGFSSNTGGFADFGQSTTESSFEFGAFSSS